MINSSMVNLAVVLLIDIMAILSIGIALIPVSRKEIGPNECSIWSSIIILVAILGFVPVWITYSVMIFFMKTSFYYSIRNGASWHDEELQFRVYLQVVCIISVVVAS